ncbi:transport and Golgi organization protein 2 isoform X3 [Vanessa cardui]|uniref:transport and Golgi organization protein 2 isoform X3 n=1 Tax=Vanessa cardui TaxID=171605 RepID=UPI001F143EF8|nr:transport and Golgi organization protein 2 isoform X3 [Vanessa cardui]
MCILFIYNGANDIESDFSLILISNRDEFYDRPAQCMAPWSEEPCVYGGRDLEAGCEKGTWLAVSSKYKKIGLLLNLPGVKKENAKSRNSLPEVNTYTNATNEISTWSDTYLGFGNSLPDKPLKKVQNGKNLLKNICTKLNKINTKPELLNELISLLKNQESNLPDPQLEERQPNMYKALSSIFVNIPKARYGTRAHTIVLVTKSGEVDLIELSLKSPINIEKPEWERNEFQFII